MNKLAIGYEMKQFDLKNRMFREELTAEEKKKFALYLMIRWGSSIRSNDRDLQEYYVRSTNERFNKHFFSLTKHPQLQWLCATTVSPALGTYDHSWIAPKKKGTTGVSKTALAELFPNMKMDDIELLASLTSKKDLDAYLKDMGQE